MAEVTWKWKRPKPGRYKCGDWKIVQLTSTRWQLITPSGKKVERHNKKLCQLAAEEEAAKLKAKEKEATEKRRPKPTDSIESLLASYRLEVSALAMAISELTASVYKLVKKIEELK
jgi:hypothetical protein